MHHRPCIPERKWLAKGGVGPGLLALAALLLLAGCATDLPSRSLRIGQGPVFRAGARGLDAARLETRGDSGRWPRPVAPPSGEDTPRQASSCAVQALPPGWPDSASDDAALLTPFLLCSSPADFLALQQRVDMPRLVERLEDWHAVWLGARGPVFEETAHPLNHKRASFLLRALKRYGAASTEVLAHFVLDSSYDDDLRELVFLLAQDKQLVELLEKLASLGPALEARGLKPSAHVERDFQWSDVGRALEQVGQEGLATSPVVNGLQSTLMEFYALKAQLPPPYQQALDAVEHEQREQQFAPSHVAMGVLDHMTFGVPLGFYCLATGTGHGVYDLSQGRYEQAVRELAPATLMVALHAGGTGASPLSETQGVASGEPRVLSGLEVLETRVRELQDTALQVRTLLGEEGMRDLVDHIRASREAGRMVAVGGVDAALALGETRGNVARAQAMLSRARPGATGSSSATEAPLEHETSAWRQGGGGEGLGALASLVDERTGLTHEVVRTKLAVAESEFTRPRLPKDAAVLERHRPSLEAPPYGAQSNPRWREYVAYYEERLTEVKEGKADKGPLSWESYEQLRGWFARGLDFERAMVKLLEEDAALPRAQRRFLGEFDKPRIERYVGVKKPGTGLRYADVLVLEEGESAGQPRRVEALSFKSRDLSRLDDIALKAQVAEDAREALTKYGETVDVRRPSL